MLSYASIQTDQDQHASSRKIKEALVINRLDKNKKRTMNHDSGIQLSRLWLDVLGVQY